MEAQSALKPTIEIPKILSLALFSDPASRKIDNIFFDKIQDKARRTKNKHHHGLTIDDRLTMASRIMRGASDGF